MRVESTIAEWRDWAAYAPLIDADRSLFAWEWLRRDARYRAAAAGALESPASVPFNGGPERFGLVAFENPEFGVPRARPVWRSEVHPYVLAVDRAEPDGAGDEFDLGRLGPLARLAVSDGAEHLLLSDGLHAIRLDGRPGTFSRGPACLRYVIGGLASAERPLLTIRRFLALWRAGRFARSLHPPERRSRRWILKLRAFDALAAGANQRQLAQELLSRTAIEPGWRVHEPSIRSRAQRLVRSAHALSRGGYRLLLR